MDHLTDAPIANILILAGVVFLAVGLFGKIGGFIGTIFGNIEAGKNARVLAGVFGSALILGGVWMHSHLDKPTPATAPGNASPSQKPAAPPLSPASETTKAVQPGASPKVIPPVKRSQASPAKEKAERVNQAADNPLVGTWTNQDPGPDRLHRFQVQRVAGGYTIHLWGACEPTDCDNGVHNLDVIGTTATYTFTVGNESRIGKITLKKPDLLDLAIDRLDLRTQGRLHHDWVFAKGD